MLVTMTYNGPCGAQLTTTIGLREHSRRESSLATDEARSRTLKQLSLNPPIGSGVVGPRSLRGGQGVEVSANAWWGARGWGTLLGLVVSAWCGLRCAGPPG